MLRLKKWTLTFFVVAACAPSAWCQQWTESFENGQGGAKPYHNIVRRRDGLGGAEGDETTFVYWTEANDGTVVELRQTIPVRVLPPLK